jgi:hypothetical protein
MSQGTSSGSDSDSDSDYESDDIGSEGMYAVTDPNDIKSVRLVQLFMTSPQQPEPVPWDGKKPVSSCKIFVGDVEISDETYDTFVPLDSFIQQKVKRLKTLGSSATPHRDFGYMRKKRSHSCESFLKNDTACRDFVLTGNEVYGYAEKHQPLLLQELMSNRKIYRFNIDKTFWYNLSSTDKFAPIYDGRLSAMYPHIRNISPNELRDNYSLFTTFKLTHRDWVNSGTPKLPSPWGISKVKLNKNKPQGGGKSCRRLKRINKRKTIKQINKINKRKTIKRTSKKR